MLGIQHERDLLVRVIRGNLPNQIIDVSTRNVPVTTGVIQRVGQFGRRTTGPADREISHRSLAVNQDNHFGDEATQQVLAITVRRCRSLPNRFQIRPGTTQPLRVVFTEWSRTASPESGQLVLALSEVVQSLIPGIFQGACHQPVLRFDPTELAFCSLRFVPSSLHQQLTLMVLLLPGILRFLECGQRCIHAGRRQSRQKPIHDPLLQPESAEALAFAVGRLHSLRLQARVPRNVASNTGVGHLHFSSAPTAAEQPL